VYGAITYGFVNNRRYENSAAPVKFGGIMLNNSEIKLTSAGADQELIASVDIKNATFSALKWSSSAPAIATVDETGRVTAVAEGSCIITCSALDGSVTATCNVVCDFREIAVNSISFNPSTLSLIKGQSQLLNVVFDPVDATNQLVSYTLSQPGIVEVDQFGRLTALSKGNVIVIATSVSGGKKASCEVTVDWPTNADFGAEASTGIRILPNPAKKQLTVNCPTGMKQLEVFNLSGKRISSLKLDGEQTSIYSKEFCGTGLFFVRVTDTENYTHLRKVLFE
jgi:uncharacterized protein YjdB